MNLGKESRNLQAAAPGWQSGHSAAVGGLERGWVAQFGLLDLAAVRAAGDVGEHGVERSLAARAVAIEARDARFSPDEARALLAALGGKHVAVVEA